MPTDLNEYLDTLSRTHALPPDFSRWARALAEVETGGDYAARGDGGLALGPWQMHPTWFVDWPVRPQPNWSWETWQLAALRQFFQRYRMDVDGADWPLALAMHFHLGHPNDVSDRPYAERFVAAWAKLTPPTTSLTA